ncbi:hypothetical protein scyTo_0005103 [Scyliorhinus torazame]|uniref:Uncharacterized protein n=1 Tax=Scyliorhinus torazame TaxID=75743 RepID=A0A401P2D1_SCYTO|nr:hypothetical protein [Scyliorhinus torazame]
MMGMDSFARGKLAERRAEVCYRSMIGKQVWGFSSWNPRGWKVFAEVTVSQQNETLKYVIQEAARLIPDFRGRHWLGQHLLSIPDGLDQTR